MSAAFGVVEQAIARGPIPGAAAAVGDAEHEDRACFGVLEPGGARVTEDTWYDLASLTKVLVTMPLCLEWIASGRLDPRAAVRDLLPEVAWLQGQPNLGDATVLQLATHTSGLAAWEPLYTLGLDRATLLARVLYTAITGQPGAIVYSDLGIIVLGHILERLSGCRIDQLAHDLFSRLSLAEELAYEVSAYAGALLECRVHPPALMEYLSQEHAHAAPSDLERRGFGWVLMHPGWSGGDLISARSSGHTGFTGTGLWIDLEHRRYSVLLSNCVHPSRHVESGIVGLRRAFNHAAHAV